MDAVTRVPQPVNEPVLGYGPKSPERARWWGAGLVVALVLAAGGIYLLLPGASPEQKAVAAAQPSAVPVSVSVVEPRKVALFKRWLREAIAEDMDSFAGAVIPARPSALPSSP